MSVSDPVSEMLLRIRNAILARHEVVEMGHSSLKTDIARILKREGYVADFVVEGGGSKKLLRLYLKYAQDNESVIKGLRRVSTPGRRRYVDSGNVPRTLGGLGTVILSTSSGVMTGREARQKKIGGEVLCEVW